MLSWTALPSLSVGRMEKYRLYEPAVQNNISVTCGPDFLIVSQSDRSDESGEGTKAYQREAGVCQSYGHGLLI